MMLRALACACLGLSIATGVASAVEPHSQAGRLPGFPRERGVIPVLDSPAAMSVHERLVNGAFSAARAEQHAVEPNESSVRCPEGFAFTQNTCYHGGPVLRGVTVHLIFWLGPNVAGTPSPLTNVKPFPPLYRSMIERYFTDVAHDKGVPTDVYAVDPQFFDETGRGVNESQFSAGGDVSLDSEAFPVHTPEQCSDPTEFSEGPCLLDSDLQKEVTRVAGEKGWSTGLGNIFFVFTAPGVGSCARFGCAYQAYCAYHSDFGGDGVTPGPQTVYADMPYAAPGACSSGVHPNEAKDEGTDAAIDVASHEFNEAITDPLGSQCKSKTECEPLAWTDVIGQEIGDKCLPPETTIAGIYGEPLVEGLGASSYNQVINGHHYWTQTEWSNEAGVGEGRCVQRFVNAAFTPPSSAKATVPASFDGSASGEGETDRIVYWVWAFGDGMQVGTPGATVSHTYAEPGVYGVTLTAFDAYGNSNTRTLEVEVGAAPPPTPPPAPVTLTKIVTVPGPVSPVLAFTATQIAEKLGLPGNGTTLPGLGAIPLGHAECPPACSITLKLYATVRTVKHRRRTIKRVLIGTLTTTVATKGTGALALALNAPGRKLLAKSHKLSSQLAVTVVGQEGGAWQINRSLTLTSSGRGARRARHHL
jgi:hypothetical protein